MTTDTPTFRELLELLTRDTPGIIHRDDGPKVMQRLGLLQQLREAVFSGMETTGGSSAFSSKPPIDAAAADLLDEISDQAAQALAAVDNRPTPFGHAEAYVRLWAAHTTESELVTVTTKATVYVQDQPGKPNVFRERTQYTAYRLLAHWVERVEDFFNPPNSKEIQAPCPNCGERYYYRMKDGQVIRSAAVNIIRDRNTGISVEAKCSACTRSWPRSQFEFLAELIGSTPIPELRDTPETTSV